MSYFLIVDVKCIISTRHSLKGVSISPNLQFELLPLCSAQWPWSPLQSLCFMSKCQAFHWPICDQIAPLATQMQMNHLDIIAHIAQVCF